VANLLDRNEDLVDTFNRSQIKPASKSKKARLGSNTSGAVSALPTSVLYGEIVEWKARPNEGEPCSVSAKVGDLLQHEIFPGTFKLVAGHPHPDHPETNGYLSVTDVAKGTDIPKSNCSHFYPAGSASAFGFGPAKGTPELTASAKAEAGKWIFTSTDGQRLADFAGDGALGQGSPVVVEAAQLDHGSATGLMGPAMAGKSVLTATGLSAPVPTATGLSAPKEDPAGDMTHAEVQIAVAGLKEILSEQLGGGSLDEVLDEVLENWGQEVASTTPMKR